MDPEPTVPGLLAPAAVGGEPDAAAIRAGYALATDRVLRRRFALAVALLALFVGLTYYAEGAEHPEHARVVLSLYLLEMAICAAALVACRLPRLPMRVAWLGAATWATLAALLAVDDAAVGTSAETGTIAQVCLMTGLAVLLPWGWRPQAAVCAASLVSFALVHAPLAASSAPDPWVGMLSGATASLWGAFFLDRHRYQAFVRDALLGRASAVARQEAEISTAIAHVGETLSRGMGRSDLFESVNRLAIHVLGCDWSSTFVFDDRRQAFRLGANVGSSPEVTAELVNFEFPRDSLQLFAHFRPGELVEVADAAAQSLIPFDMMGRFGVASALYAPIWRGEQLIGVLVVGYRARTGRFDARQRRLALGIADATAIAIENERLVADLQAANRLKSEFVSTMSHELRTPLNVITGFAEMLADPQTGPLDAEQRDLVGRIQRNAKVLLELIGSTLDLGRLEAGRDPTTSQPVDVGRLFAEIADEVVPLLHPGEVRLSWDLDGLAGAEVFTDRTKLKTIVKNLVGNALKFTPRGAVTVAARAAADGLAIEVRDTGIGIAPEDLPEIFEMFRQVDGARNHPSGGVGLGLHIAKRLAERLGGSIAVESRRGGGSTFTVRLPAGRPSE